jgi:hypothetical protein
MKRMCGSVVGERKRLTPLGMDFDHCDWFLENSTRLSLLLSTSASTSLMIAS